MTHRQEKAARSPVAPDPAVLERGPKNRVAHLVRRRMSLRGDRAAFLWGCVTLSATSWAFIIQGADVDDLREGARFFTDAVGHFPSFWELSLRKKPHASVGPNPRFYGTRMWDFFSHTRPQNRKVQPPAEVKECATVLAGVRSSPCPVTRTCEYVCHNS